MLARVTRGARRTTDYNPIVPFQSLTLCSAGALRANTDGLACNVFVWSVPLPYLVSVLLLFGEPMTVWN